MYVDSVIDMMNDNPDIKRTISIIGNANNGKSTITNLLLERSGIFGLNYQKNNLIQSAGIPLYFEYIDDKGKYNKYLIYLISSPKDINFSFGISSTFRITDGALVIVDYTEGVSAQTETILRQSMLELVKPVLMINKIDKALFELRHDSETMYQNFLKIIEDINIIISIYMNQDSMGNIQLFPDSGNVAFGSALQGWAFTIDTFAKMYYYKLKIEKNKLMKRLWGDNYYNPKQKKWSEDPEDKTVKRAFCASILEPIMKLAFSVESDKKEVYEPLLKKLHIELKGDELELKGKYLVNKVLTKFINGGDSLLNMIILHLPSPKESQKYRTSYLYEGPMNDECAKAMMSCDRQGPVMMYISKMVNISNTGKFYAFGRIFSGELKQGQKVIILGPNYKPGKQDDLHIKTIRNIELMIGERETCLPCGNICFLEGIDEVILNQGTITTSNKAHTIRSMKYSTSPFVRVAVNPQNPADLPKLVSGLINLSKVDPFVEIVNTETEHILCGSSELHLEQSLKDLVEDYAQVEIIKSKPFVAYKETVTTKSTQICMSKSPNKYNILYAKAEPLNEDLVLDIENDNIKLNDDLNNISKNLIDKYKWDENDAKKLWIFDLDKKNPNLLIDQTKNVQYINEIRDSMKASFMLATRDGILAEENMRGIKFGILDAQLHNESIHRGGAQIIPTGKRLYYACQMTAAPRYQEPIYLCHISVPKDIVNNVYKCFTERRGVIFYEKSIRDIPLVEIKAYLPVSESFGLNNYLNTVTSGQSFLQYTFDHWELIKEDPFDVKSKAYELTMNIRKRKGLKQELPIISDYIDID